MLSVWSYFFLFTLITTSNGATVPDPTAREFELWENNVHCGTRPERRNGWRVSSLKNIFSRQQCEQRCNSQGDNCLVYSYSQFHRECLIYRYTCQSFYSGQTYYDLFKLKDKVSVVISEFSPYPGSKSQVYTGNADLTFKDTEVAIIYNLTTFDQNCTIGKKQGVRNSCGISIHDARSCSNALDVGKEFHLTYENPWVNATYQGGSGRIDVDYGHSFDRTVGRALVIHDSNGHPVTCNIIESPEDSKDEFRLTVVYVIMMICFVLCCIGCSIIKMMCRSKRRGALISIC